VGSRYDLADWYTKKTKLEVVKMSSNAKKAIITLLGGAGVIVLLIGLFTGAYDFFVGLIAAIAIWIVTGAASTWFFGEDKKK
jgi:hypothetical protein